MKYLQLTESIRFLIELSPSLGSSSKPGLDFRLEVNKTKARARTSLIFQGSIELFLTKITRITQKFSTFGHNLLGLTRLERIFSQAEPTFKSSSSARAR